MQEQLPMVDLLGDAERLVGQGCAMPYILRSPDLTL
jgi:hypothetical protein